MSEVEWNPLFEVYKKDTLALFDKLDEQRKRKECKYDVHFKKTSLEWLVDFLCKWMTV